MTDPDCATTDPEWHIRQAAVRAMVQHWPDEQTRALLTERATTDPDRHALNPQSERTVSTLWVYARL